MEQSGFGYDNEKGLLTAPPEVWAADIEVVHFSLH